MTTRVLSPGILAMLLSAGLSAQQEKPAENPEKRPALSKKNATAEELESVVLALGLDAHRGDLSAEHPSKEDLEAYQRAGFGSWLDTQLKTADDSIAPVPLSIRSFLEGRQPTLWRVVGLLERGSRSGNRTLEQSRANCRARFWLPRSPRFFLPQRSRKSAPVSTPRPAISWKLPGRSPGPFSANPT